ncbi:acyl carrier protein phosphodiesterase [Cesiribacter andamanensis]|uniref:Acyl carrier protein phosphodiesterase n=1 Tax=Cesiribacter andamanensis AMV16 TaxID=1279009 RepID=M7N713_9BACT|nr:ACP phosphodiesterase [Cesiribacter andamanensis]EMR04398.1 acyl carrier protein phosphodiesterase [Cesiribacter andamanensis AMV16]
MNFLAHVYLSGTEQPALLTGNFIGDFVKGKELEQYPAGMQQGIRLHRAIDSYTDSHPLVVQGKKRLFPKYRHYGRVLVDLYYDHLLAANFERYANQPLLPYTLWVYELLQQQRPQIPASAYPLLDHMQAGNWLYHYRSLEGIGQACKGMARRTRFRSGMEEGALDLERQYALFEQEFFQFFDELRAFVEDWLRQDGVAPL